MGKSDKKEVYSSAAALVVLFFILAWGYFSGDGDFSSGLSSSPEIGISSLSPRGISGGLIIPASCPSYEHFPGECAFCGDASCNAGETCSTCSVDCGACPIPPTANIWANGLDGPVLISNNGSVQISWTSANASSCGISKNTGPCGISGSNCAELSFGGSLNNSGPLTTGSYNYIIDCNGPGGNVKDTVTVNVAGATVCNDGLDNDGDGKIDWDNNNNLDGVLPPNSANFDPGCTSSTDTDETNRYVCGGGACVSAEGSGPNTGSCNYTRTYDKPVWPGRIRPLSERLCALTQCNDTIDNDNDGKIDLGGIPGFPRDPGCISLDDNNELNTPEEFKECGPGGQAC